MASICIFLAFLVASTSGIPQPVILPVGSIALNSPKGRELLQGADCIRGSFYRILSQLETQQTDSYCGVASSVTCLNALPGSQPPASSHFRFLNGSLGPPYDWWSQDNFFNRTEGRGFRSRDLVLRTGFTLDDLAAIQNAQSLPDAIVEAKAYHQSDDSLDEFRQLASAALGQTGKCVMVNWHRAFLNESGGGHISPLAAYSPSADMFLVLDVSRYKYPPLWFRTVDLHGSMNTLDTESKMTRGMVIVTTPNNNTAAPSEPFGLDTQEGVLSAVDVVVIMIVVQLVIAGGIAGLCWYRRHHMRKTQEMRGKRIEQFGDVTGPADNNA